MAASVLIIACGALARELLAITRQNGWDHVEIQCLPAELHDRPDQIPAAVAEALQQFKDSYRHVFVAYADCGTGGTLDRVLAEYGVERIAGAHCCEFYTGAAAFAEFHEAEPGTFYLTDFMVRHFDRVVIEGLGLDKHPELKSQYFGNYKRVIYLAQSRSDELSARARQYAEYLGLEFRQHYTGLEFVEGTLREQVVRWQN